MDLFPEPEKIIGVLKAYALHDCVVLQKLPEGVMVLPDTGNPREVRTEEVLVAEFFHGGKIFEEIFRRQSGHIDINVFETFYQKLCDLVPESPPPVAEYNGHIRKIIDYIVKGIGIGISHLCSPEQGRPCVKQDREALLLAFLVHGVESLVVCIEKTVNGVDLQPPRPFL